MLPVSYLSVRVFVNKDWRSLLCIDHYGEQFRLRVRDYVITLAVPVFVTAMLCMAAVIL